MTPAHTNQEHLIRAHQPGRGLIYAGQPHSLAYIYADLQHCGLDYDDQRVFMAALMWSAGRDNQSER